MLHKNRGLGPHLTDLDTLLELPNTPRSWTAPRWLTQGDILFFYHTVSAERRIAKLLRALPSNGIIARWKSRDLRQTLERAAQRARELGGTIFAVAEVSEQATYARLDTADRHFESRVFAPFERCYRFAQPLPASAFNDLVTISRQMTITLVEGAALDGLKERLAQTTNIPPFLAAARSGGASFRDVGPTTWQAIACDPATRFLHEAQLRAYFIDYLLDTIKDPRSSRLEECETFRLGARKATGIADYFIMIDGRWVPVEAKLSLGVEANLAGQLAQYLRADTIKPRRGVRLGERIPVQPSAICLVIDQAGLYLTRDGVFVNCSSKQPLLTRPELGQCSGEDVRAKLRPLING